jgi:hypothetical protein
LGGLSRNHDIATGAASTTEAISGKVGAVPETRKPSLPCLEAVGLPWLDREFGWSDRTAQKLMNVYEAVGSKASTSADLALPVEGLYRLARPSAPQAAREEII